MKKYYAPDLDAMARRKASIEGKPYTSAWMRILASLWFMAALGLLGFALCVIGANQ
jgi:hypothetical protein